MTLPSHTEFLGITGSGKSTLVPTATRVIPGARTAKETYVSSVMDGPLSPPMPLVSRLPGRLRRNVIRAYARLRNVPVYAYHDLLTEHPNFTGTVERVMKRIGVDEDERVRRLLIRRAVRYGVVTHQSTPLVFDEGFAMGAVLLFSRRSESMEEELIREYMDAVPWPDLVIKIDVDPELCYRRSQARAGGLPSSIAKLPVREQKELIADMANCVTTIANLAERRGTSVIEVDNSESLPKARAALEQELRARIDTETG